jgi:Lon protease-like protein
VLRGFMKFRITSEVSGKAYRLARVEPIPEVADEATLTALKAERPALEAAIAASLGIEPGSLRLPSMSDEDLVGTLVMNLDFDTVDRQLLIEQPGVVARARKLIELLQKASSDDLLAAGRQGGLAVDVAM